jgi:hypothetical protein
MSESSRRGQLFSVQQTRDTIAFASASLRISTGIFFTIFGQYKVFGTQFVRGGFREYVGDLSEPERTLSCFPC